MMKFGDFHRGYVIHGILTAVELELARAEQKHRKWPEDLLRQVMIVSEEMGEVQQAALNLVEDIERSAGDDYKNEAPRFREERHARMNMDIDDEMVQVAAMALRFLYNRRINRDRA